MDILFSEVCWHNTLLKSDNFILAFTSCCSQHFKKHQALKQNMEFFSSVALWQWLTFLHLGWLATEQNVLHQLPDFMLLCFLCHRWLYNMQNGALWWDVRESIMRMIWKASWRNCVMVTTSDLMRFNLFMEFGQSPFTISTQEELTPNLSMVVR